MLTIGYVTVSLFRFLMTLTVSFLILVAGTSYSNGSQLSSNKSSHHNSSETFVCLPSVDVKQMTVQLERCKLVEQLVEEHKKLVQILEEENQKLREQVKLLKEITQLEKAQKEFFKDELAREKSRKLWNKVTTLIQGTVLGAFLALVFL